MRISRLRKCIYIILILMYITYVLVLTNTTRTPEILSLFKNQSYIIIIYESGDPKVSKF